MKKQFAEFKELAKQFALATLQLDMQSIAHIPAVKQTVPEGPESPVAITVSELLTMVKMSRLSDRVIVLAPSYDGKMLDIYSALKRPEVPDALLQ